MKSLQSKNQTFISSSARLIQEETLSTSASSAARETLTAAAPVNCGSVDQQPAYSQESWLEKDLEFTIYNLQYINCNL